MAMDSAFAEKIQQVSVQFLPFMVAVIFHEYAHGWMALRHGDPTAKDEGRLTLNPTPHIDILGTILLPLLGMFSNFGVLFGWAKPVPINPNRFKKYRPGLIWVSIAGSGMNFILAVFSGVALMCIVKWLPPESFVYEPLRLMALVSIQLNFMLGFFNLLPIPPLDGSKIIQAFMPFDRAMRFEMAGSMISYVLLALAFIPGALSVVFYPIRVATEFCTNAVLITFFRLFNLGGA